MEEEAGESGNKSVGEPLPVESIVQVFPVRVGAFDQGDLPGAPPAFQGPLAGEGVPDRAEGFDMDEAGDGVAAGRSEEHTSELPSLMRISYAVFCLKQKTKT